MANLKAVAKRNATSKSRGRNCSTPLTSLAPPPTRAKRLRRSTLNDHFVLAQEQPLTLLVAPQGYGKTQVLSAWHAALENSETRAVWVTLEAGFNGPSRLARVLTDACAPLLTDEEIGRNAISDENAAEHVHVICNLLQGIENDFVVIIDQLETLTHSDAEGLFTDFLFHLPPSAHAILASTATPAWMTPKLQLDQDVQIVGRKALAFSVLELEEFLKLEGHSNPAEEEIVTLMNVTGGWPAAIRLASLALKKARTPREHAGIFHGEFPLLFEYLERNIIAELTPDLQSFLHHTAHLQRLRVDLCNHVSGSDNASECLDALLDQGLVEGNKYSDNWLSFQPLLRNFLSLQLKNEARSKKVERHCLASDWYRAFGMPDACLYHALQAQDYERAVAIYAGKARELVVAGGAALIEEFVNTMPPEKMDEHPYILWPYVWMLVISQRFTEAAEHLPLLQQRLDSGIVDESSIPMNPTAEDLTVIEYRIKAALDREWADPAVWLKVKARRGSEADFLQEQIELSLGAAYFRRNKFHDAYVAFQDAKRLAELNHTPITTVSAATRMAEIRYMQGELSEALYLCAEAIDLAALVPGQFSSLAGIPRLLTSRILFDKNQLAESEQVLYEVQGMFRVYRATHYLIDSALHRARLANAGAGWQNALHILEEALGKLPDNIHESHVNQLRAAQVQYQLLGGQIEQANSMLQRLGAPLASRGPSPTFYCKRSEEYTYLSYCRMLIQTGNLSSASAWLTKLLNQAKSAGKLTLAVEVIVLLVMAHNGGDDERRTLRTVREMLMLARQTGVIRPLIEAGAPLQALVRKFRKSQLRNDFAEESNSPESLIDLLLDSGKKDHHITSTDGQSTKNPAAKNANDDTAKGNAFTPRELELLSLIGNGLSNKMIANELIIGEGTVKWHLKNIFLKLSVGSRTQAVSKARSMGLLD